MKTVKTLRAQRLSKRLLRIGMGLSCLLAGRLPTNAATLEWSNPGENGDFASAINWNPAQVPVNNDSITLGAASDYTVTRTDTSLLIVSNMWIGAGATLDWKGGILGMGYGGSQTNAGVIRLSEGAQSLYLWSPDHASAKRTVHNPGIIEVDGTALTLNARNRTIDCGGSGLIRIVNGGSLSWPGYGVSMSGGTYSNGLGSTTFLVGSNRNTAMTGVAIINEGHIEIEEQTGGEASGNIQYTRFNISNGGSLNNRGTLMIRNCQTSVRRGIAEIRLSSNSSFANTGTITIDRVTTNVNALAQVVTESDTLNEGVINIVDSGGSYPPADPADYRYDSEARFIVNNGNSDFTQTGAGAAVNLADGGKLVARKVDIQGGHIGGKGLVGGSLSVAAGAAVTLTLRASEPDALTVSGTAALADGAIVRVALEAGFDPESDSAFDVLIAAQGFVAGQTLDDLVFDYSEAPLQRSKAWGKPELVVEAGGTSLRLKVQPAQRTTVVCIR